MNRIQASITALNKKTTQFSAEKRERLTAALTLDVDEYRGYQNCQARAHAEGTITADEAQTLYLALKSWNTQTVSARIVVTQAIKELLTNQIGG
jgi:hypothetical protein